MLRQAAKKIGAWQAPSIISASYRRATRLNWAADPPVCGGNSGNNSPIDSFTLQGEA
jgi:hypothetical protein